MAKRIAVAVRNATLRQLIAERLRSAGAKVEEFEIGLAAFNAASDGVLDALVLDLHLSDMHGDDVCRDLKSMPETMATPVLMLVEEDDAWFRERCQEAGADATIAYEDAPKIVGIIGRLLKADVRVATPGRVQFYLVESSSRDVQTGAVADVSISGLAFGLKQCELEKGFKIDVRLQLPGAEPFMGRAEVVRVNVTGGAGYHVRARWLGFRKGDQPRLQSWILGKARGGG